MKRDDARGGDRAGAPGRERGGGNERRGRRRFRLRALDGGRAGEPRPRELPVAPPDGAPCPCGSGRSWGSCCGPRSVRDQPRIREWAASWQSLTDQVLRFATDFLAAAPEPCAVDDLPLEDVAARVRDVLESLPWPPMSAWLTPWSLYWWRPAAGDVIREICGWTTPTLAEEWIRTQPLLSERERAYLEGALGSAFSFLEVEARAPAAVFFRDLLLDRRHVVSDPSLARDLREGWVVYGAIARMPFGDALLGTGPLILHGRGPLDLASLERRLRRRSRRPGVRTLQEEWRLVAATYLAALAELAVAWETDARVLPGGRARRER